MNNAKKQNLEGIEFSNKFQKNTAIIIADIIDKSGKTQKQFAEEINVSLATITNIFRPAHNKVPSIKVIKKIADQTQNPEETYKQLMEASCQDYYKHPYMELEYDRIEDDKRKPSGDASMIFRFSDKVKKQGLERIVFGELMATGIPRYATAYPSKNTPIKEWNIEFHTGFGYPFHRISEFIYRIVREGHKNIKYSLVTNSPIVYDELSSLKAINIIEGIHISVILYKSGEFIESYVTKDHKKLDEAGLSL